MKVKTEEQMVDHRLDGLWLSAGAHSGPGDEPGEGMCVMELTSMLAGEPFSDRPDCVSPSISNALIHINDGVSEEARQLLRPYALRVIGTRVDETPAGRLIEDQRIFLWEDFRRRSRSLFVITREIDAALAVIDQMIALSPGMWTPPTEPATAPAVERTEVPA